MSRKFLLISQVFYPDQVSTANLFTNLCSVLAKYDIEVEVWAGHPTYTESERQPRRVIHDGINIYYLPSSNFHKSSFIGRILNMISFTFSAGIKILFSNEKTPVWTHTNPPFLGIFLSLICFLKRRKFVYILQDIYPEGLVRLGKLSGRNPSIRFWQWLFVKSLTGSTFIIVIGRDMKQYIAEICPKCTEKTIYIPNWQDDNLITTENYITNSFVQNHGLTDKFIIQYSGNMGLWNEMATIGKAVTRNIPDVIFMFVGGGIRKEELMVQFSESSQKNVILLPFQPNDQFNEILSASHVQLVTMLDGLEGMAVPCKIYGIMASGRPVIAMVPKESEIAYAVEEEQCGFVLDPKDLEGLINSIHLMKSDENLRKEFGINSRKAFETKYTTTAIAGIYNSILDRLYEN
jgi:glycosyltransferase involved in cell wall biosynthesis